MLPMKGFNIVYEVAMLKQGKTKAILYLIKMLNAAITLQGTHSMEDHVNTMRLNTC